ncbi:MAG: L-histidine N(alpha)-methyltransferase [Alphaproteobacteria bacterium]|nr:L-histidine N(alpha)-methyltransferase [Alphaproteobacteria bacterium]
MSGITVEEGVAGFRCVTFPPIAAEGADVVAGLRATPKSLPARYFYDARGSDLFERICALPEYYPTRTERALLAECAAEIAALTGATELIELGSGSAAKARHLIDAHEDNGDGLHYAPVDVSGAALRDAARELLADYPGLRVTGLIGTYEQALDRLRPADGTARLIFFLGSTLGNFGEAETERFLRRLRTAVAPGTFFLVGLDLRKEVEIVEAAYNDSQGVTAALNLNMLRHLNRRFDGDFDLGGFSHLAFYDRDRHRVEMHLRAGAAQSVRLEALDLTVEFAAGETVRTEISRKFDLDEFAADGARLGFAEAARWTDRRGWFGLILLRAV